MTTFSRFETVFRRHMLTEPGFFPEMGLLFFFHFITSVALFSITRKKNGTCHSELVAAPLWYGGYP